MLDRTDNDGHYEAGNLKWSTVSESTSNRRNAVVDTDKKYEKRKNDNKLTIRVPKGSNKYFERLMEQSRRNRDPNINYTARSLLIQAIDKLPLPVEKRDRLANENISRFFGDGVEWDSDRALKEIENERERIKQANPFPRLADYIKP